MKITRTLTLVTVVFAAPAEAWAADQQDTITLPPDNPMAALAPGPGMEVARASCGLRHSTDYIVRQPRSTAQQWQAEVAKTIKVFGAPITPDNEKTIAEYLASAYGSGKEYAGGTGDIISSVQGSVPRARRGSRGDRERRPT